ncbi:MAG: hypothetical protein RLZZ361_883 [Cyanobacteriota bacterium]|jgi:hypothetical protein
MFGIWLFLLFLISTPVFAETGPNQYTFNPRYSCNQNFALSKKFLTKREGQKDKIKINEKSFKDFQLNPFLKFSDYYQIALIIEKPSKPGRSKAFVLYLIIPKDYIKNREDFSSALTALPVDAKTLKNGCMNETELPDLNTIYYFFADMDSQGDGLGGLSIKGFMQNSPSGTGTISISKIEMKEDKVNGNILSFKTALELDLTATSFKRQIKAQGATQDGICKRTSTKFKEQTAEYKIDLDMEFSGFVYLLDK